MNKKQRAESEYISELLAKSEVNDILVKQLCEMFDMSETVVKQLCDASGISEMLVKKICDSQYDIMVGELLNSQSNSFTVPSIGTFYVTKHKGHPLNLNIDGGSKAISDYLTLKFKAAASFKKDVLGR